MKRLVAGVIDFVVGDDVWVGVGIAGAVLLTAVLARIPVDAWWLLPSAVPAIVAVSLLRATRSAPPPSPAADRPGEERQ